jgi:gliding motility-associated-like protein
MSAAVTVSDVTPEASFTIDKTKVCPLEDVHFTSTSKNAVSLCWEFGDGSRGMGTNPSHYYEKPGTYTITLVAMNAGCSDSEIKVNVITVGDPLVDFKITKDCQDPYKVMIEDLTSRADTKTWNFGDGTIKTGNVASYRYAATGEYTIKLTGTNNTSHCTVEKPVPVAIHDVKASFTIDNPKPCKNAPVQFESTSEGAASLTWDFGNGAPAQSGIQASTSYDHSDEFNVTLTAKDADGCPDVATLKVNVLNLEGNFNFIANGVSCDALAVQFNDASTANPPVDTWTWNFGDGNTATGPNPAHTYTQLGNYPVTLTLTNAEGQCSFIRYDAVVFTNPIPDFRRTTNGSDDKTFFCPGDNIQLVNDTRSATSQNWEFTDLPPSTTMHPVVSYSNTGSYVVKLDVEDSYGCQKSVSKVIEITKPVASFTADNTEIDCPPLDTTFKGNKDGIVLWEWDFGDQDRIEPRTDPISLYRYTRPGIYDVTLYATDANGCRDTVTQLSKIRVGGPDATFVDDSFSRTCVNDSIGFTATPLNNNVKTYHWDLADGTVVDREVPTIGHRYGGTGERFVSLTVFDEKGCAVVSASSVTVTVSDSSLIKFDYGPRCIFEGESFTLRAGSDDQDLTWSWDVGDTPAGTDAETTITTEKHGNYPVTLRALNAAGCTSTVTQEVPVRAKLTMIPNIFTPNGDGTNETFELQGLEHSTWDLLVYNRWGSTVYKKKNYQNDWTGGSLSSGVYFYTVTNAFCPDRNYKGTVTISK